MNIQLYFKIFALLCVSVFIGCDREPELDLSLPRQIKSYYHDQIDGHRYQSYYSLWTHFRATDAREDGYVNDIYDNSTRYRFGTDQDKGGGDPNKYNREHSFPKSWFGASSYDDHLTIYTDLFHLYPCDSKANSKRSNLPYGEVTGSVQWTNGYCKVGKTTVPGNSNMTVFEPADEIKGNLARTYFYIATRYEDEDFSKWSGSAMLTKNAYPFFQHWASQLLIEWNRLDPVDEEERKRNDAVERIQGNRNPYIDHPDLADYIWGDKKGLPYKE